MISNAILGRSVSILSHLYIGSNALCGVRDNRTFNPEPICKLADSLCDARNRSLIYLDLSKSDIGARSVKKIFEALKFNNCLKVLDISNCNITEGGGRSVGEALSDVSYLRVLDLKCNSLGPEGCMVRIL